MIFISIVLWFSFSSSLLFSVLFSSRWQYSIIFSCLLSSYSLLYSFVLSPSRFHFVTFLFYFIDPMNHILIISLGLLLVFILLFLLFIPPISDFCLPTVTPDVLFFAPFLYHGEVFLNKAIARGITLFLISPRAIPYRSASLKDGLGLSPPSWPVAWTTRAHSRQPSPPSRLTKIISQTCLLGPLL